MSQEKSLKMTPSQIKKQVDEKWEKDILPALSEFVRVPAKSPAFDAQWAEHGFIDQVVADAIKWGEQQKIKGLTLEVVRLKNTEGSLRTPVIYFEIPAFNSTSKNTTLMYGHMDKQPEFSGWSDGLEPWTPKIVDNKLYGRGAADDGYAFYASLGIIEILQQLDASHPRIVGMFEACEESGSYDLPAYIEMLKPKMGDVDMVVCLDSGAGNYEQLWMTNSLRGLVAGTLKVEVLAQGVHSGSASGVAPSSMRILRMLLERVEDTQTGHLLPEFFHTDIPARRLDEARSAADILGDNLINNLPWAQHADGSKVEPMVDDALDALLGKTWRPTLSITGVDGIPALGDAGNVLRPYSALKLSFRLPPLVDSSIVGKQLETLLTEDAPYHAKVSFQAEQTGSGWSLPEYPQWLDAALEQASQDYYGKPCAFLGEGGSIPLINMLQTTFPKAQMLVCGVLGPNSNAHGPNEFLHIPYAKNLTACIAQVLASHP